MPHRAIAALALGAMLALGLTACGHPQVTDAPPPAVKAPTKRAPAAPDAFADHSGPRVGLGEVFRVKDTPYAVEGAGFVVALLKATWTKRELPDGRTIREGAAELEVRRGQEHKRPILEQEESAVVYGYRITVKGAGEDYDDKRLDYLPWVELMVERVE
jgi:hypothetical protein